MNSPHPDHQQPQPGPAGPGAPGAWSADGQGPSQGSGTVATAPEGTRGGLGRPAPTRSNSSVIIATLIAVVVITGGLSAWLLSAPSYDRTTAEGTAEAFADAVNARNIEAARELLCGQDRSSLTEGASYIQAATLSLNSVDAQSDSGQAHYQVQANLGSQEISIALQRDSDTGEWSVCPSASDN